VLNGQELFALNAVLELFSIHKEFANMSVQIAKPSMLWEPVYNAIQDMSLIVQILVLNQLFKQIQTSIALNLMEVFA